MALKDLNINDFEMKKSSMDMLLVKLIDELVSKDDIIRIFRGIMLARYESRTRRNERFDTIKNVEIKIHGSMMKIKKIEKFQFHRMNRGMIVPIFEFVLASFISMLIICLVI